MTIRTVLRRLVPALVFGALALAIAEPAGAADLPAALSADDAERYRKIMALQERGDWAAADKVIKTLDNDVLMGHVLYQRYMHPTAYRSKYSELKSWLDRYADQPDADKIHALALKRRPRGAAAPKSPRGEIGWYLPGPAVAAVPQKSLSRKQHSRQRQLQLAIAKYVNSGWPTKSLEILSRGETQSLFSSAQIAKAHADIARSYYVAGVDEKALDQAEAALATSEEHAGFAHWTAGLAAWRMGRFAESARHFEALTTARGISSWNIAAGAFWAARAHLVDRKPAQVNRWLEVAAQHPRSFYGILARRALGFATTFAWTLPGLTPDHERALRASGPAMRGLALLEIGEPALAERELMRVDGRDDTLLAEALLKVADGADLPGLSLRVGQYLERKTGRHYDAATYPLPHWQPPSGYIVDRALVFAFMRQESRFDASAMSHAGARGLMQIMPGTAYFVSGDSSLRRGAGRNKLLDPEFNIDLGQQYLRHLLELGLVEGDLFRLATAYNGGPGNLQKWSKETAFNGDPLLFIESIPSRETRIFIERVVTNFWIYRQRLGQPAPSLDKLAAGDWPSYAALGNGSKVASDGRR